LHLDNTAEAWEVS